MFNSIKPKPKPSNKKAKAKQKLFASGQKQNTPTVLPKNDVLLSASPQSALRQITAIRKNLEIQLTSPAVRNDIEKQKTIRTQLGELRSIVDEVQAIKALKDKQDFDKWLLGRGDEKNHLKTAWYRTPLIDLPGVSKYLDENVIKRYDFMKKVKLLELNGATDLTTAKDYFKFIVRGSSEDMYDYKDQWSLTRNTQEEINSIGEETVNRLNAYIIDKQPIKNKWDLFINDFEDYIQMESSSDALTKQYLNTKITDKQELMLELLDHPNYARANDLIHQYITQTQDLDNVLLAQSTKVSDLQSRRDRLVARFHQLSIFNPQLFADQNNQNAFQNQIDQYDKEIDQLKDNALDLYQRFRITDNETFTKRMHEIEKLFKQKSITVPEDLQAILNDQPVNESKLVQDFVNNWGHLLESLGSLLNTLKNTVEHYRVSKDMLNTLERFLTEAVQFLEVLNKRDAFRLHNDQNNIEERLANIKF